jgi:isopenicillin N synthase-like dioxygenase
LKEGFYIGDEISTNHPYFVQKKLNSGPNQWPQSVKDPEEFKNTANAYYQAAYGLAKDILRVLALTLNQDESFFDCFADGAVATMRLLHYPPQPKDSNEKLSRGIGAHQDFGAVTLLLQGEVDGLQVLDAQTGEWFDVSRPSSFWGRLSVAGPLLTGSQVEPVKGAYVVNLGNLFMKWSNDKYRSNVHRVINKSGK